MRNAIPALKMETILELKNVSMKFGGLAALQKVDCQVQRGEIFGLAGPNGSGKTTLFNVICGLLRGSGEIFLDGHKISGLSPHVICQKGIARTFQTPSVFHSFSVRGNLAIGAYFGGKFRRHKEDEKVREVVDFIGLGGKEEIPASSLSLMDRKLTVWGMALAVEPLVILLDEPLAGLSPNEIQFSLNLFQRINKELNVTLIIIEHMMRELMRVCNHLMILHYGNVIFLGRPEQVLKNTEVRKIYLGEEYA